jgi:hypothetical protein
LWAGDRKLIVGARPSKETERRTRCYPVRDEFWQSIRSHSPREFFEELGIKFPSDTSLRREHGDVVVTHDPETVDLVGSILRSVLAYHYQWQLQASIADEFGNAASPPTTIELDRRSRSTARLKLGGSNSHVDLAAKEEYWYRDSNGVRFPLDVRVVREGKTTFRQQTTLVLGDKVDTLVRLGGNETLRLMATCQLPAWAAGPKESAAEREDRRWAPSHEQEKLLQTVVPPVSADATPLPDFLRLLANQTKSVEPGSCGLSAAYLLSEAHGIDGKETGLLAPISIELDGMSVAEVLQNVCWAYGLKRLYEPSGTALCSDSLRTDPLSRQAYGPLLVDSDMVEDINSHRASQRGASSASRLATFMGSFGVDFPPGARFDYAPYRDGWVVVATNTADNLRGIGGVLQTMDGGLFHNRISLPEVRLVRLPETGEGNLLLRDLLDSRLLSDRVLAAGKLAEMPENTHLTVWTSGVGGYLGRSVFPGRSAGAPSASFAIRTRPYVPDTAMLELDIDWPEGCRRYHCKLSSISELRPCREYWVPLRADALDPERGMGERTYILMSLSCQRVEWSDINSRFNDVRQQREWHRKREAEPQGLQVVGGGDRTTRTRYWDLFLMFGLIEAGDGRAWASDALWLDEDELVSCWRILDEEEFAFTGRLDAAWSQCRLLLSDETGEEVTEVVGHFGEDVVIPVPGNSARELRFRMNEIVRGERMEIHSRGNLGFPQTRELRFGERVQLRPGLWLDAEAVDGSLKPVQPAAKREIELEQDRHEKLLVEHREMLKRLAGIRIPRFHLNAAPLPVAIARLGDCCGRSLSGCSGGWHLRQPILIGILPKGARKLEPQSSKRTGGMDDATGLMGNGDDTPRTFVHDYGTQTSTGVKEDDEAEKAYVPDPEKAVPYELPVPDGRATLDLLDVTVAEILAELEKAYGTPLYLREKDGAVLVRAAPLLHLARFGVPKRVLKDVNTQQAFREWLRERGVDFQEGFQTVYFRTLDTAFARGSESFLRQVGKALAEE